MYTGADVLTVNELREVGTAEPSKDFVMVRLQDGTEHYVIRAEEESEWNGDQSEQTLVLFAVPKVG